MTKMKKNFKNIYFTVINSFLTITAVPFPLRSMFTTNTFIEIIRLKYMQRMGRRVVVMIIISMKMIPYVTIIGSEAFVGILSFVLYTVLGCR